MDVPVEGDKDTMLSRILLAGKVGYAGLVHLPRGFHDERTSESVPHRYFIYRYSTLHGLRGCNAKGSNVHLYGNPQCTIASLPNYI